MQDIKLLMNGKIPLRLLSLTASTQTVYHMTDTHGLNKLINLPKMTQICTFTRLHETLYKNIGVTDFDYTYLVQLTADVLFKGDNDIYTEYLNDGTRFINLNMFGPKSKPLKDRIIQLVTSNIPNLPAHLRDSGYIFIQPYLTDASIKAIKQKIALIDWEFEINSISTVSHYNELVVSNATVTAVYRTTAVNSNEPVNYPVTGQLSLEQALTLVNGEETDSFFPPTLTDAHYLI